MYMDWNIVGMIFHALVVAGMMIMGILIASSRPAQPSRVRVSRLVRRSRKKFRP